MDGFLSAPQRDRAFARVGSVLKQKWHLERVIGVGGMATVYAASHRTGHAVAVKVLHAELAQFEEIRARFAQEPYVANRVDHKGVVRVIDDDVADDGALFVVMELLAGESLDELCRGRGGRLELDAALEITDQLLDVLAAAHAVSILHRDVKPQNVFVTHEGIVKLLDFGVARAEVAGTMTRTGGVLGTPAFMPPEQARGRVEMMDPRSDLWAVGATLFTMLSGEYVHSAGTAAEFLAAAMTPARSIERAVPGLPPAIVDLVDRALAYERADRWPTAQAMQAAAREARMVLSSPKSSVRTLLLPSGTSSPGHVFPVGGPGGTLLLRDSIPDWFASRPGTICANPAPPAQQGEKESSEDIATNPRIQGPAEQNAQAPLSEGAASMSDRWYVSNGAVEVGPVGEELVRRGVEAGKIPEGSFVRHETWDAWQILFEVFPGVHAKASSAPPPALAPSDQATSTAPDPSVADATAAHPTADSASRPAPGTDDDDETPIAPDALLDALLQAEKAVESASSPAAAALATGAGVTRTAPRLPKSRRAGVAIMATVVVCALAATAAWLRGPGAATSPTSATGMTSAAASPAPPTSEAASADPMPAEGAASTASATAPFAEPQTPTPSGRIPSKAADDPYEETTPSKAADDPYDDGKRPSESPPKQGELGPHSPRLFGMDGDAPAAPSGGVGPQGDAAARQVQQMLDQQVRQVLEPKVRGGKASLAEIDALSTICSHQHDLACVNRAKAALRRAQAPHAKGDDPYQ